ncbi:TPA: ATP-dependent Clp protease ATP-binding subunit [Streptococcus agalactiae]|uniref:ATP-dependent Clp protease ATP-binding subunit n=1 Tax=Streptococcus canis TaxID=1329 RepID=A0AAE4TIE3_STRCB|nr:MULTISPECIES: ATP-dependent Clp protease ATP-binding subunit [Streptococcus]HEM9171070.1 ATP-dependent Clp protease ATP-binding subunit [Streptococcus agalactiae]HEP2810619.1 ATP-dependent Clp protease ATP-binding subunit [Streptococcus pyogenes]MDV5976069.1 ATP-dependent Clp protease ATP-binding subunit [Streptococcus canis]QGH03382.1 ATP-dependent Clp protease ATP-binding subunit [Streptococcus dysgalactiae subsp. dysgalactiae]GAY70631.1 ATP-dependent Clp protease [Streptococcus canis]
MEDELKTPYLDQYTDNLTAKVTKKSDDYQVYGRNKEVQSVIISLLRRTKNNPILVGEAGVGKTAIVEGLTLAILRGQVPEPLKGLTVRSLELSSLMSEDDEGFIAKFKKIIEEMVATRGHNLLFVDEFHTIIGAGSQNGQALDAGNVIKPFLARGDIQLIGATTLDEFHEYIETDRALERRMQPVMVEEPTIPQAITIIEQAKVIYEKFHGIQISSDAVHQAIRLSVRYLTDRFLPDKAFDLIDEAATIASAEGKSKVTEKDIAQVLKDKTGIPVTTILKGDQERLEGFKEKLMNRVKGQEDAIEAVVDAVTIAQAGLQNEKRPLASFLFLGPTGVGKTELAKAIAEALFDDEAAMIRFDMSEYKQKEDVTKLIGNRATRIKGQLTEGVKQKPYCVLLLDEIEKAHSEVMDLFLQVLDDGRLTDSSGRLISFKNTIVIMTTNIGAKKIINKWELKGNFKDLTDRDRKQFEKSMDSELQNEFRPEFLNRIENKLIFNLLERDVIEKIAEKNLSEIADRMKRQNLTLSYEPSLIQYLSDVGTDVKNGARPLERLMKRKVLAPISVKSLQLDKSKQGYNVHLWVEGQAPDGNHRQEQRQIHMEIEGERDNFFS